MIDTFMHINTDAQRDNLDMQYWDLNWWEKAHSRGEHKETYVVIFRDQKKNNKVLLEYLKSDRTTSEQRLYKSCLTDNIISEK